MINTRVEYHYRSGRDVRLLFRAGEWAERNLKSKGFLSDIIFLRREMTKAEVEDYGDQARLQFEKYTDWQELIEDDKRCDVEMKYLNKIKQFARKHSLPGIALKMLDQSDPEASDLNKVREQEYE